MRRDQLTLLALIGTLACGGSAMVALDPAMGGNVAEVVESKLGSELALVPRVTSEAPISLTASDGTGLRLASLRSESVVVDPLSFTELHLSFENPENRTLEGRFNITLPPGASISRFAMKIDGAWQEAEVVEKQRARQTYEDFLHRKQDPALLEQGAGNAFSARVFPIPARGIKEIVISYSQELSGERVTLVPLAGLHAVGELDVAVNLPGGTQAPRRYNALGGSAPGDLTLLRTALPEQDGVRSGGEAIVKVRVPDDGARDELGAVLLLVDTSASRALGFEEQLRVLQELVKSLGSAPVAVVAFDQTTERIFQGQASAFGAAELDKLRSRGALGATDLYAALGVAATEAGKNELRRVVLIGDGVATAGGSRDKKLAEAQKKLHESGVERFDVIAFGGIRDEATLSALVTGPYPKAGAVARGDLDFDALKARLTRRSVRELAVNVEGAIWSYPKKLSGLQSGDERLVYVQSNPNHPVKVSLGDQLPAPKRLGEAPEPLVQRALAKAKIDDFLEGDLAADEKKKKVTELSIARRVLSPFTSLLVLETEGDYRRYGIERKATADIMTVQDGRLSFVNRNQKDFAPKTATSRVEERPAPADNKEGGTGTRAKGEEGKMHRFAVQSPRDESDPHVAREAALQQMQEFGMIGLLNAGAGGAAPPAPAASAPDPASATGNLWGDAFGDAFGAGGLGQVESQGFGAGHGRLAGSHRVSAPKVRQGPIVIQGDGLDEAAVQRVLRQNFGRYRMCYEQALGRNPAVEGSVAVRFTIASDGKVPASTPARQTLPDRAMGECLAAAHRLLTFPVPERGVMNVVSTYEFAPNDSRPQPVASGPAQSRPRFRPASQPSEPPPAPLANPEWPKSTTGYEGKLAKVMQALAEKNVARAVELARSYRAEAPGDVMALVALGQALKVKGDVPGAERAFGSIIDLFPDRADLRRFAGVELEALDSPGALALAEDTFRKAQEDRPDHSSTYRLLAYSLVKSKRYAEAFEYLEKALAQGQRYHREGTEQIMREDLGLIAAAWKRAEPDKAATISERLAKAGGVLEDAPSTRFVLNWETDANDVDLHVYDGLGDHASYQRKQLSSGGFLYADVTNGYGPECFTLRGKPLKPVKEYTLQVHYYARGAMGFGMGKLQIVSHDGKGDLRFDERPFVVMTDRASIDLGTYQG